MFYKFHYKSLQWAGLSATQSILTVLLLLVLIGVARSDSRAANVVSDGAGQEAQFSDDSQPIIEGGETSQIFLPFVSSGDAQGTFLVEHPPQKLTSSSYNQDHVGNSDLSPPESNNHTFVTDSGGNLDQYVGRADLPDGLLTFSIGINGPVLQLRPDQLSPDGTVAVLPFLGLVDQRVSTRFAYQALNSFNARTTHPIAGPPKSCE